MLFHPNIQELAAILNQLYEKYEVLRNKEFVTILRWFNTEARTPGKQKESVADIRKLLFNFLGNAENLPYSKLVWKDSSQDITFNFDFVIELSLRALTRAYPINLDDVINLEKVEKDSNRLLLITGHQLNLDNFIDYIKNQPFVLQTDGKVEKIIYNYFTNSPLDARDFRWLNFICEETGRSKALENALKTESTSSANVAAFFPANEPLLRRDNSSTLKKLAYFILAEMVNYFVSIDIARRYRWDLFIPLYSLFTVVFVTVLWPEQEGHNPLPPTMRPQPR